MASPRAASDPTSGSVSANAPIFSSLAIDGSQRCFCSSEPHSAMVPIPSASWPPKKIASDGSMRASSTMSSPWNSSPYPAQPWPVNVLPARFNFASAGTIAVGNSPRSQWSAMIGATSDSR